MNDNKEDGIAVLIKFLPEEFVESTMSGVLHMKPMTFFSSEQNQDKSIRDDKKEGAVLHSGEKGIKDGLKVFIGKAEERVNVSGLRSVTVKTSESEYKNLFCMAKVMKSEVVNSLDGKEQGRIAFVDSFLDFGSKAICILGKENIEEFIRRITKAIQKNELFEKGGVGSINYYDESEFNGGLSEFNKSDIYEWQKEWRFSASMYEKVCVPLDLDIGSIYDIAIVVNTDELINDGLKPLNSNASKNTLY